MKKITMIITTMIIFTLILTGCNKVDTVETEIPNTTYVWNDETKEVEEYSEYIQKGEIIQIPVKLPDEGNERVIVETVNTAYLGTVQEGYLYYFGKPPTEDNYLGFLYKERTEDITISKDQFEKIGEMYIYKTETPKSVIGINVLNDMRNEIRSDFNPEFITVEVNQITFAASNEFHMRIWIQDKLNFK